MLSKRKRIPDTKEMLIKSSAYDALIEHDICSLPVSMPQDQTVIVFPMQCLKEPPINCDIYKYDGVLMRLGTDDNKHYVLMYDNQLPHRVQNWVISKLLFYVKNGIADQYPNAYINCDSLNDADSFASHFTCPDVILEACEIKSTEEIMDYCEIPFDAAFCKSKYLKTGYEKFVSTTLEKVILNNFKSFLDWFHKR